MMVIMNLSISYVIQLLKSVNSFIDENKKANQNQVLKHFQLQKITQGTSSPNYLDSKQFCLDAKILKENGNFLYFTPLGNSIFDAIDLPEFNRVIVEKCIFNNYFSEIITPILSKFHKTEQNELWYEINEIYKLFKKTNILEILYDVGFLHEEVDSKKIIVNPQFLNDDIIKESIKSKRKQSQAEIDDSLLIQKKIGQTAEKIVLKYEKDRLTKLGSSDKSQRVEQISDDWANKGYDIESFNGEGEDILPDRFIEVKGSSGKRFSIFWSQNEIKKAKELGDEYWIYFVPEIDINTDDHGKIERIQNPFDKIKPYENNPDDDYMKKIESIHITKNN